MPRLAKLWCYKLKVEDGASERKRREEEEKRRRGKEKKERNESHSSYGSFFADIILQTIPTESSNSAVTQCVSGACSLKFLQAQLQLAIGNSVAIHYH